MSMIESLESRRLLSASAALAKAAIQNDPKVVADRQAIAQHQQDLATHLQACRTQAAADRGAIVRAAKDGRAKLLADRQQIRAARGGDAALATDRQTLATDRANAKSAVDAARVAAKTNA